MSNSIKIGAATPSKYYIGVTSVSKIMNGSIQVWVNAPPGIDSYAKLVLHADTAGFVDSSLSPKTPTIWGSPQLDTVVKKFGAGSLHLTGDGQGIIFGAHTDWDFGTNPFTVEFWVYVESNNGGGYITADSGSYDGWLIRNSNDGKSIAFSIFDTYQTTSNPISLNSWAHIAMVRDGTSFVIYHDGLVAGSWTISASKAFATSQALCVGNRQSSGYSNSMDGRIDEVRISKGIARYSGPFTPPTEPFI